MSKKVTLGGERLGSGKKMKVELHGYERSTHDVGGLFRSTISPGTLVPFLKRVALPGDTFDIELNASVLTLPTVGPLFGSYKLQCDVFSIPIRLYQAALHNNMLGIGNKMEQVKLPQIMLEGLTPAWDDDNIDNSQTSPSSLMAYLGIRGAGMGMQQGDYVYRDFNALPVLMYWDIYKNYYANKQEPNGAMIARRLGEARARDFDKVSSSSDTGSYSDLPRSMGGAGVTRVLSALTVIQADEPSPAESRMANAPTIPENANDTIPYNMAFSWQLLLHDANGGWVYPKQAQEVFQKIELRINQNTGRYFWTFSEPKPEYIGTEIGWWTKSVVAPSGIAEPQILSFPLENIDKMRERILQTSVRNGDIVRITGNDEAPYGTCVSRQIIQEEGYYEFGALYSQQGLALKTYQSDKFNNWLQTELITGPTGINELTKVSTAGGGFTIDALRLANKVNELLNRIMVSGGTYNDWLDAVWMHDRTRLVESPVYHGGLIKEVVFQEVVSTAEAGDVNQPLGTLAGRGRLGDKHKGGKMIINVDEPSYIMGILSLTPRIDYSQGNDWDGNLKTMNDLHKPALDAIGFQDSITDERAWWDTEVTVGQPTFRSAGKVPAWLNYMTDYNRVLGNFAIKDHSQFMVLTRRYEMDGGSLHIKDLTTYIDPSKFNHIFAETEIDACNFWVQIGMDITARRKMSAKIMPNL